MSDIKDDIKPAGFTGAATAVLGTVGGLMPAAVHSIIVSGGPLSFAWMLTTDVVTVVAIGAGQGLTAAATALARGRGEHYISPKRGLVGALVVGAFNGLMYFAQMAVPATELGWTLDLIILGAAGAAAGWYAVKVPEKEPAVPV
ncbi:MAG: hypothetical protein Q8Q85_01985 [Gemmatimonadales bacterium]|nr:hypothetical protein [Gemmatimonadales bacterium]